MINILVFINKCSNFADAMNQTNESDMEKSIIKDGITAALATRGITQKELAERMGQHPVALNATIRNPNIQLGTLMKMAAAIGCDVSEFFSPGIICPHCGSRIEIKAT